MSKKRRGLNRRKTKKNINGGSGRGRGRGRESPPKFNLPTPEQLIDRMNKNKNRMKKLEEEEMKKLEEEEMKKLEEEEMKKLEEEEMKKLEEEKMKELKIILTKKNKPNLKKTTTRKNLEPIDITLLSLNGIKKLEPLKQAKKQELDKKPLKPLKLILSEEELERKREIEDKMQKEQEEEEKKAKEIKQMKENKTFKIKCIINSLDRYFDERIELRKKRNNEELNLEIKESYEETRDAIFQMTLGDFLNGNFLKSNKKNVRILLRIYEVKNQIEIYKQEISEIVKNDNSKEVSSLLDFKLKDLNEYNDNC